jgi:hypothetical protein
VAGCSRHPTDVRPSRADGPRERPSGGSPQRVRRGGSDAATGRGRVLQRPTPTRPGSVRRQPIGRESRWGVTPTAVTRSSRSSGTRMARPTGRCVRGARPGVVMCAFASVRWWIGPSGARVGSPRTWRCTPPAQEPMRQLTTLSSPVGGRFDECVRMEIPRSAGCCGWSRFHASGWAQRNLQIDLETVAWPGIPRVALALLPTETLRRRTSGYGSLRRWGDVDGGCA